MFGRMIAVSSIPIETIELDVHMTNVSRSVIHRSYHGMNAARCQLPNILDQGHRRASSGFLRLRYRRRNRCCVDFEVVLFLKKAHPRAYDCAFRLGW